MARRKGEFSIDVYNTVLSRQICEECGCGPLDDDPWRVHHRIWLDWGIRHGYSISVLKSIENSCLLHESCHHSLHNELDEPEQRDIDFVLSQVAIQMKMF